MIIFSIFFGFIMLVFWLSWYLGKKDRSADGFFVAGGQIHWFVNGIALIGGYLSAASFLGICGMIAFKGFDGYLYSIGFLSGWVVALFVVAEPMRRLGKYTFADAIESRFHSRAIHLAAGISTLVICICYIIPQMVGAGVLIEPLLGVPHHWGVILVGTVVIVMVASAGMSSTTYVQFLNAGILIIFCTILVTAVFVRGLESTPSIISTSGQAVDNYLFSTLRIDMSKTWEENLERTPYTLLDIVKVSDGGGGREEQTWVLLKEWVALEQDSEDDTRYHLFRQGERLPPIRDPEGVIRDLFADRGDFPEISGVRSPRDITIYDMQIRMRNDRPHLRLEGWWNLHEQEDGIALLHKAQNITRLPQGDLFVNGLPAGGENVLLSMGRISRFGSRTGHDGERGPMGPLRFLSIFADSETEVELPRSTRFEHGGRMIALYYHLPVAGNEFMRPGMFFEIAEESPWGRLDFISLMTALFLGTAALPHVLIRYYTVRDSRAARRSTIIAISALGLFYILTMFLGLGAVANGVLNPQSNNMTAPLLARSFGGLAFAILTGLAFTTVLATTSGLLVAASGAVANDLLDKAMKRKMTEDTKVFAGKFAAVSVGLITAILGILLRGMNVGFLVGLAFAVAASANFPSIIMVLFWKKVTARGIVASIFVGIAASLGIILMSPDMFALYGLPRSAAWFPLSQPAIISMPLSFLTLVTVSLLTQKKPA